MPKDLFFRGSRTRRPRSSHRPSSFWFIVQHRLPVLTGAMREPPCVPADNQKQASGRSSRKKNSQKRWVKYRGKTGAN